MFRPGKNPKDQPHTDDTADHTPHAAGSSSSSPASSYGSGSSASAGSSSSPTSNTGAAGSDYSAASPNASRAVTESESLAREIKDGTLTGFVGNGTSLTGEASFKGMLRVDGHLSGRVSSSDGTLIVSTNGQVDANVEVAVAQIYGTVNGDIIASKRIEMGRVAKVTGNVQTPALVIENGALFEGSCRMMQQREELDRPASRTETSTAASAASTSNSSSTSGSSSTSPYASAAKNDKSDKAPGSTSSSGSGVTTATDAVS